jgi:diguanylate cyclase (GGDEF)-like protein/PAS domain S-box-containing protein
MQDSTIMSGIFNRFTSRVVMGELLIHGLLAAAIFLLILPLAEQLLKNQFLDSTLADAKRMAVLLEQGNQSLSDIDKLLGGKLKLIHLDIQDGSITSIEKDPAFADKPDNTYYIAVPLHIQAQDYILQLGYDESETRASIEAARRIGIYIIAGYLILALLIAALIGPRLARPLRQLGEAARQIATGEHARQLDLHSNVGEIKQLISDLESMRSELISQREALATREARLSAILTDLADGLITIDSEDKIQSYNLTAERIFGYPASEVVGQNANLLFGENADDIIAGKWITPIEIPGKRKNGVTFQLEVSTSETSQLDEPVQILVCRDISARKQTETRLKSQHEELERSVIKRTRDLAEANRELKHQALHDSLTGLPNRVLLHDRLSQAILSAKREGHVVALMISDLDRFKEVNDTLGHHYGDLLLQQVGMRLRSVLRDSDTVARLGGDEFAILLPDIMNDEQATQIAEKIAKAVDAPFIFENHNIHVGISIGISLCPMDSEEPSKLMRQSDIAMYAAKHSTRSSAFYKPELDDHSISRLSMAGELRRGLQQKQFILHYQPTIDLREDKVIGVEALVRWQHPEKGLIAPDEFIQLAENSGHIRELTSFVLEEALQQLHLWNSTGLILRMSINLSAHSLHDAGFCDHIHALLQRWQIQPDHVQLEITERALMRDPTQAMKALKSLSEMGIKLAIDNFGTGYSSLSYLKQLPVQEIKVDRSFVHGMLTNGGDKVIVRTSIVLAHSLRLKVIAEGVDNETSLALLKELNCDLAQGYHIHSPGPADELRSWIQHSHWHSGI